MTDPTPDNPSRLQQLFLGALEFPPEQRDEWLREQCGEDDSLFQQVQALLAEDDRSSDPLEQGAQTLIRDALDEKLHDLRDGLHVRCPHCQNPIELIQDGDFSDVTCPSCGSTFSLLRDAATVRQETPGKTIAHFELIEQVGVGAFGSVWKARDTQLDRMVAIKIPRKDQLDEAEAEKFLREARSAAQLKHPGIVSVHEVGREDGQVYIVSDFVQGVPLSSLLTARRPTLHEAAQICAAVAEALQHAHDQGVIHRDLKPANIMIDDAGEPHLMDFGLAKRDAGEVTMTLDGKVLGTPAYMSPEQARGEAHHVDGRSDIYSLGAVLFELLTGERPFRGDTRMLIHQVINDEPPSPRKLNAQVPKDLETICLKCLEKDPDKRYASAKSLQSDLQHFLDNEPIVARPIGRLERGWRWCKRKPAIASLTALLLVSMATGVTISSYFAIKQSILAGKYEQLAIDEGIAKREAEQKSEDLNQKTSELTQISKAARLTAESQSVRTDFPVRSLLLGIEAFQTTSQIDGPVLSIAHENLFGAINQLGGRPCVGHEGSVSGVAISPDGHWLVTGSFDNTARLWDLKADDPSAASIVLRGHTGKVTCLAISPDAHWLVTGSGDKTARVWDLTADDPSASSTVVRGHNGAVHSLAISPDSHWLAIAAPAPLPPSILDYDWHMSLPIVRLCLWELTADDPADSSTVLEHSGSVESVAFSPNGRWLAAKLAENNLVWADTRLTGVVWDLKDLPSVLPSRPRYLALDLRHEHRATSFAFSPDGNWLVTCFILHRATPGIGALGDIEFSTLALGASVAQITHIWNGVDGPVSCMAISPDSRWLVTGSWNGTVRLGELAADDPTTSIELRGHDAVVTYAMFSPDGRWLVTGSDDKTARVWDLTAEDPAASIIVLRGHEGRLSSLVIGPDGRWLATGSDDKTARLWDLTADDPSASVTVLRGHEGPVRSLAISPDSRWLVTASNEDKIARLWDLTRRDHGGPATVEYLGSGILSLAVSPDGEWIATTSGGLPARLWNLTDVDPAKAIALGDDKDRVHSVSFSPDGRWLATVSADQTVRVWELKAEEPTPESIVPRAHPGKVTCLAISPNAHWLATGSSDRTVRLWDLTAKEPNKKFVELSGHELEVSSVAFSPDSRWLATGSSDRTVRLWDLTAVDPNKEFRVLRGHEGRVPSVAFSPDGHWLCAGSYDKAARLWDLTGDDPATTPIVLRGHEHWVRSVAFSADGRQLITGSQDGTVRFWDLDINTLIKKAKRAAGRELTPAERKQYLLD